MSRKTKICYLESPAVVDKQIGCLHVSVEDVVVVEVAQALEQLEHVALDLCFLELDFWVVEEAGQIVVHVRSDHVQYCALPALGFWSLHCHLLQSQDVVVRQHLQQLDFSQRSDREAVLLVVHQNLLQREDATC